MTTAEKRARARALRDHERMTIREIAATIGVSVACAHRYVNPDAEARYQRAHRETQRRKRAREKS